ncbi:MAG: DUF1648 domain-containing protein [Bacteroidota bacterium]
MKPKRRPQLTLEWTLSDRLIEILTGIMLTALIAIPLYFYDRLPDLIPIHFNLFGEVDGYGSKQMIWLWPALGLAIYGGLGWMNKRPHNFNYLVPITDKNARVQYTISTQMTRTLRLILITLFVLISWSMVKSDQLYLIKQLTPILFLSIFVLIAYSQYRSFKNK